MKLPLRSLALTAALALTAGAAVAAEAMKDCCCKDKAGKMSCCDDMKKPDAPPPAPEHKH